LVGWCLDVSSRSGCIVGGVPHLGSPSVGHPVVSGEGRWVEPARAGVTFPNYGPPGTVTPGGPPGTGVAGPVHPTVSAEGEWVFDPDFATVAPPVDLEAMFPDQPVFDPRGGWGDLVNWWFSHSVADLIPGVSDVEDLPSGGGLMIGPQEMAKTADFLKDALMPLLGGDLEVLGLGGVIGPLGPTDPVPIPGGKIVAKGADLAKAGWRAVRGVDEAAEAVSAVVRVGDDLTPGLLRSQGFLGDARLAPTRNIGEGVTVSEIGAAAPSWALGNVDRPFVLVRKADGSLQPFYRSTGANSGMEGRWLPFDGFGGVVNNRFEPGWYRKNRFGQGEFAEGTPLHRFGSEENKALSDLLGAELGDAPATVRFTTEGADVELFPGMSYDDLNEALGTHSGYGDYLAATVDESPTFTGNPMRVEASGVARETGEAAARTDAEARAVIKSLEETAAPAASGVVDKPMWHGSSQRFDTFSAGHGDERALFGLGVYTTDDMSVAAGYSRKKTRPQNRPLGGTPGSEPRERLIYNVVWRGENPPRVLDLEATMPDEVRGVARSTVGSLDQSWVTDYLPIGEWDELVSVVDDPASTFEDFYRKMVRVFAESEQPSTEFIDTLQDMSDNLVEAGVDAFRYTGGKRVGKGHLHEAMVWLDSESVEVVQAGNIEGLLRGSAASGVARETGEAAVKGGGEIRIVRHAEPGTGAFTEGKPQGLYVTPLDEAPPGGVSLHSDLGEPVYATVMPKNPLEVPQAKVTIPERAVFRGDEYEADAGVSALRHLLDDAEWGRLMRGEGERTKEYVERLLTELEERFPGFDYRKMIDEGEDAYSLLGVYGSRLASEQGYDVIILRGKPIRSGVDDPHPVVGDEMVVLDESIISLEELEGG